MTNYPKVVTRRAEELLESGNQPTKQFANNKATLEYDEMKVNLIKINEVRVSKGEKPASVQRFKDSVENISVKQYLDIMRRINHMANNLPK